MKPDWKESLEQRPTEVELEYVDPYDQKLEPGEGRSDGGDPTEGMTAITHGEQVLRPGEFRQTPVGEYKTEHLPYMSDAVMEVQEGAVMNTPGYEELAGVLVRAYDQAASGKGKERHANDAAFVNQPMQTISDLLDSDAGMAFQAIKKIKEARGLSTREAQVRELLGAINYVAGMVLWLESQPMMTDLEAEDDFEGETGSVSSRRPELLGGVRSNHDEDLMYVPSAAEGALLHASGIKAVIKDGEVRYEHPEKQQ